VNVIQRSRWNCLLMGLEVVWERWELMTWVRQWRNWNLHCVFWLLTLPFFGENLEGREGFGGINLVWFWKTESVSVSENVWSYRDGFWIYNRRALRVWSIYGYVPLHPNYKVSSFIVNFNYHSQWVMVLQFEFNIYVIIKTKIMLVIFNHLTMWGVVKQ